MEITKRSEGNQTRRDFLKSSGRIALVVGGALSLPGIFGGCATTDSREEKPITFPPLKGHKVQPSIRGCYTGFHGGGSDVEYFVSQIGRKPRIMVPAIIEMRNARAFPKENVKKIASAGVIPFVYKDLTIDIKNYGFKNLTRNTEFKEIITDYAKEVTAFGKPIFVSTLREINGPSVSSNHMSWRGKSSEDSKAIWRYIWQIFEDNRANDYATWVWSIKGRDQPRVENLDSFYPGDQYVDWIGISAYSRNISSVSRNASLRSLAGGTYRSMRRRHPDKPIMIVEFGKSKDYGQARWIRKSYEWIRSTPGIKAAIYWDNLMLDDGGRDNHQLSPESWEALEEILDDPYFIGAI